MVSFRQVGRPVEAGQDQRDHYGRRSKGEGSDEQHGSTILPGRLEKHDKHEQAGEYGDGGHGGWFPFDALNMGRPRLATSRPRSIFTENRIVKTRAYTAPGVSPGAQTGP